MQRNRILQKNNPIIAMGASTGGTEAILSILKQFTKNTPGILIVQHMPPIYTKMYAERLNDICEMNVKEAQNGDIVIPGRVLIAPGEYHMELKKAGSIYFVECFKGEKVNGHCPSVDILFQSVAEKVGAKAIGILLTGMGRDGAKGLLSMKKKGAKTIAQDEKTSTVYGMPKVAKEIGAVQNQVPLSQIPQTVSMIINKRE